MRPQVVPRGPADAKHTDMMWGRGWGGGRHVPCGKLCSAMVMIIAGGMEIMIIGRKLGLGSFV